MHGLIHQYVPQKSDFASTDETEVELIMDRMNNKPRNFFGLMSALQKYFNLSVELQS
jgi:IS30 family transposase